MSIRINVNHENTQEFLWHIIKKVATKKDLKYLSEVPFMIQQNKDPFPEFQYYNASKGPEYAAWEMAINADPLYDNKGYMIINFLKGHFGDSATLSPPKKEGSKPLTYSFTVVVGDVFGVRTLYQKLKAEMRKIKKAKNQKDENIPQFKENTPRIIWEGKTIDVPPNSIEHTICKVAFEKAVREEVAWDEVKEVLNNPPKEELELMRHSVYDAIDRLNARIKKIVGKELFKWTKKAFIKLV